MNDPLTAVNMLLIIFTAIASWYDRRRLSKKSHVEPIVIQLSISVDPTMKNPPIVTAYQSRKQSDSDDNS